MKEKAEPFYKVLDSSCNTAITEVITNTSIVESSILLSLLGLFILYIPVVIVKNIKGITVINNIFKNKSPNGVNIFMFSLNIKPSIPPIIIEISSINDSL